MQNDYVLLSTPMLLAKVTFETCCFAHLHYQGKFCKVDRRYWKIIFSLLNQTEIFISSNGSDASCFKNFGPAQERQSSFD